MLIHVMGGMKIPKSMSLRIPINGGMPAGLRHKALWCTHLEGDSQIGQCKWEGSAPFYADEGSGCTCEEAFRSLLVYGSMEAGGEKLYIL